MTKSLQPSVVLAVVAVAAIVAGVVMLVGTAWGLITAGGLGLIGAVVLYDPAGPSGAAASKPR